MHQLRQALVVVIALCSTAAFADQAPSEAKTTATKAAKRIPTKTPMSSPSSPSLAQLVALGRDEAPTALAAAPSEAVIADAVIADAVADAVIADRVIADTRDVKEAAKTALPAFPSSTSSLPAGLTSGLTSSDSTSTTPWAAVAFFIALIGGAAAVWWRKKQGLKASGGPLLNVKETTSIGPRRQLLVVDVAGRRVLLSSSEAGVSLLLDCGTAPVDSVDTSDDHRSERSSERFFGDALASAIRHERQEPTAGLQLVTPSGAPVATSLPAPPALMPPVASASGPVRKNETEASELLRRLGR